MRARQNVANAIYRRGEKLFLNCATFREIWSIPKPKIIVDGREEEEGLPCENDARYMPWIFAHVERIGRRIDTGGRFQNKKKKKKESPTVMQFKRRTTPTWPF